jgi:replicative DNA helicase
MEADGNPARAALLQRAARLAKESATLDRMQTAGRALETRQYALAIQEQQVVRDSLKQLLDLLQSENRADRIREERARVEQLIKDIQTAGTAAAIAAWSDRGWAGG